MDTEPREVEYYETENGRVPCREWIDALKDRRTRAKIWARIDRVRLGNLGHCGSVGSGVMELKIDYGPGYRVYFGQVGSKLIILLCGGDKSTQQNDIAVAQSYWVDYRRRYEQEQS